MKQEDKELLFKDLSARLPYVVICTDSRHGDGRITEIDIVDETVYCDDFDEYVKIKNIKPYLRPMSSMTEEEFEEYTKLIKPIVFNKIQVNMASLESFDYLNKKMFDYRGLIPKGLAIEAPKDMYK